MVPVVLLQMLVPVVLLQIVGASSVAADALHLYARVVTRTSRSPSPHSASPPPSHAKRKAPYSPDATLDSLTERQHLASRAV